MKKNTVIYLIAFLFFGAGIGWLCLAGFSENSVYFLNVAEAHAAAPKELRQARLFGVVAERDLTRNSGALSFNLMDKDDASLHIPVVYKGAIPDTFKPGVEVIVEGGIGDGGRFSAKTLMTKCPSRYQKENRKL